MSFARGYAQVFCPTAALEIDPALASRLGSNTNSRREVGSFDHVAEATVAKPGALADMNTIRLSVEPATSGFQELAEKNAWNVDQHMGIWPNAAGVLVDKDPTWFH